MQRVAASRVVAFVAYDRFRWEIRDINIVSQAVRYAMCEVILFPVAEVTVPKIGFGAAVLPTIVIKILFGLSPAIFTLDQSLN